MHLHLQVVDFKGRSIIGAVGLELAGIFSRRKTHSASEGRYALLAS